MTLEHSGWSQAKGWFCDKYSIDTTRTDHEIHWKNGKICKQTTPFESEMRDWNLDGDEYELFGAYFEGLYGGGAHYTPENLLSLMLDGEAIIPGIKKL